jgi:HSP20 family protein
MLSDALDTDRLEADLRDGVLTITVPVDESSKQRRVKVTAGGKASAIETTGSESDD